jgi:hypothetical protein
MDDLPDLIDAEYDGPHTAESVTAAARALAALVRHLNNATRDPATLPYAGHVYDVLGSLSEAAAGLDQLTDQLTTATDRHAADPTLYDDRRDRPGRDTAHALIAALYQARLAAGGLAHHLGQAQGAASHLAHGG